MVKKKVFLSLGTNVGDRPGYLHEMGRLVQMFLGAPVQFSSILETEPLGVEECQQWFLNQVVSGYFAGNPGELLTHCHDAENALGRSRPKKFAPRTADIDILLFGNEIIHSEFLTIPHHGIGKRKFCLLGLSELAPDLVLPGFGKTAAHISAEHHDLLCGQRLHRWSPVGASGKRKMFRTQTMGN